jgi:nitrogen-specific signal transduction histidine kinase
LNTNYECFLYTEDVEWSRYITGMLKTIAHVQVTTDPDNLRHQLNAYSPCLVLYDLRTDSQLEFLQEIMQKWDESLFIGFGQERSVPVLDAESLGIYTTEDLDVPRKRLQSLIIRSLDHLETIEANRRMSIGQNSISHTNPAPVNAVEKKSNLTLQHFSQTSRAFSDIDLLLQRIVEGVEASVKVARCGIFLKGPDRGVFQLKFGLKCSKSTYEKSYDPYHPLTALLKAHPSIISRWNLSHIADPAIQRKVEQELVFLGAEVIIPIFAQGEVTAFLFLGPRLIGKPYDQQDLEDLIVVSDHISTTLENALLYEEAAVQRMLATTLLQTIPSGIVAINRDGTIRWFNDAASQILDQIVEHVIDKPIEILGTSLTDVLRRTTVSDLSVIEKEWTDNASGRTLKVESRKLISNDECVGAVAIIRDRTNEIWLEEKNKRADRSSFWAELAAAMSHEIRNPLVAINTFAQLLPERYDDEEFRSQFSVCVQYEVQRLNNIIKQINEFGDPPDLQFQSVRLQEVLNNTRTRIETEMGEAEITLKFDLQRPSCEVLGDAAALTDCLTHLIQNAIEASTEEIPAIQVSVREIKDESNPHVQILIEDNGCGIPQEIQAKIFSPFCTTKARGMGLGLPIAQRTVLDHNGKINIESGKTGTKVSITLPER